MPGESRAENGVDPLRRVSIADSLTDMLRTRILRGEWRAGLQLRQHALAEEYQVSRMPVREALRQLEKEGLVTFQVNKGAEVSRLSIEELEELFDLRLNLECDIVRQAIGKANEEDIAQAEKAHEQLNKALAKGDIHRGGELNWVFHNALYNPANKPHTINIIKTINYQTDRFIRLYVIATEDAASQACDHHDALLEAYRAKDSRAAVAALKRDIVTTRKELVKSTARLGYSL